MKQALIIFVRNPVLGKVKTRIAKTLGEENALKLYKKLLAHTQLTIEDIACDKYIFYADEVNKNDDWSNDLYYKEQQVAEELGERMSAAFEKIFGKGYNKVLIIGSDCYELTTGIIEEAFAALEKNAVVVGPAKDGGYYLLGMKKFNSTLFESKAWSTNSVLQDTLKQCTQLTLSYYLLPLLSDVDEATDINFEY